MSGKRKARKEEQAGLPGSGLRKPGMIASLRSSFFTGIVISAPIFITIAVLYWLVTGPLANVDGFVQANIPRRFLPEWARDGEQTYLFPSAGVLLAMVIITLLGIMTKNIVGRFFINLGQRVFDNTPVVKSVYGFFKNVFEMALQQSEQSFKEVALIEYPRPGLWTLCFVVTSTKGEVRHQTQDIADDMTNVFVPTTPNPTSGFLLFVPKSTLRPLSMSVEDGAKLIFSAGLVAPEFTLPGADVDNEDGDVNGASGHGSGNRAFGLLRRRSSSKAAAGGEAELEDVTLDVADKTATGT